MSQKKAVPVQSSLPTIAIVGRPNVGKSSLFNAIIGRRMSIVHEESGVTRDRVIAPASYRGRHFQLIDTGGLGMLIGEKRGSDVWDARITEQAIAAVEDADVLIFVTNVQDGIHNLDQEVARRLHMLGKPVLLAANKSDNPTLGREAAEFSELGFPEVFPVSCLHSFGVESVLAAAVARLPETSEAEAEEPVGEETKKFRIAVVGRPNVGKSSLVNALLGDERVIVSDVAGTTRDAIDIDFELEYRGEMRPAVLVDTAGLRRRGKVDNVVEYFSVMRAQNAIERANLVLFVVEASPDGVTSQDKTIASMVEKAGKACVVVGNKFDLWRNDYKREALEEELRRTLPGMKYAPLVFVSAREKRNLGALLDQVSQVLEQTEVKISTGLLNRVIIDAVAERTPPVIGAAPLKVYYASMIGHEPPRVLIFVNNPKYCGRNYLAYLKNVLRAAFDLTGLPLEIILRARPKTVQSIHSAGRTTKRRPKK